MQESQPDAREDVYFVLTSLAHVIATVLFGELLNLANRFPGLLIIGFAVTSKTFALFAGENERFFRHLRLASVPLAAASFVFLAFLPPVEIVLGALVVVLYLNYPRLLRAREKSPLDILFHGSRYAMLFWLGYGGAVDAGSVAGLTVVFLFGVAGELLVGLRSNGNTRWRTTASKIGVTSTVRLVNILSFALIVLGAYLVSTIVVFPLTILGLRIPIPLLLGIVIAFFITRPVSRHRSWIAPISVRRREIIVLVIIALLFVGIPVTTRVHLSQTAPPGNYTATVGMRLIATGQYAWEGQWIIFNYHDSGDYYYLLLHTDGTLELSRYVNGTFLGHVADVRTDLSPFDWHEYTISVQGGEARISIDGTDYINATIPDPGGEVMITQDFPITTFWVVSVTEFRVS